MLPRFRRRTLGLLALGLLPGLLIGEVVARISTGAPLLASINFRNERFLLQSLGPGFTYDAQLGWRYDISSSDSAVTVVPPGIRLNDADDDEPFSAGEILAVGGSPTSSRAIRNEETWAAALESLLGRTVANAGVDKYASDQALTRAMQLIPALRPSLLLVQLSESMVADAALAVSTAPKPYYAVVAGLESGQPAARNLPVPSFPPAPPGAEGLRVLLGHSKLVDAIMHWRPLRKFWLGPRRTRLEAGVDSDAVTCGLLRAVRDKLREHGGRLALVLAYEKSDVLQPTRGPHTRSMLVCAGSLDLTVVDALAHLAALSGSATLESIYASQDAASLSELGNQHLAAAIAASLGLAAPK